jgi:hypothetical protein
MSTYLLGTAAFWALAAIAGTAALTWLAAALTEVVFVRERKTAQERGPLTAPPGW